MDGGKEEKMKESLKTFLSNGRDHGLYVIEMPTGSGKTYNVAKFIHDYLEGKYDSLKNPRIFYLTPQRKNVQSALEEVKEQFRGEEGAWQRFYNDSILLIQANVTSVIDHILDSNPDDEFSKTEPYRLLRNKVKVLKEQQDFIKGQSGFTPDLTSETEEIIRQTLEPNFRRKVEDIISKWTDCKSEKAKISRIKTKHKWLLDLYPAILTSERKVIFTTVDKFYQGNNPIVTKSYHFLTSPKMISGALVFIDESDASKKDLLDKMIEKCTEYRVNLLSVINRLYHSTVQDKVPEELFLQKPTKDAEKTTKAAYEKLKKVLAEAYENHNLKYQFKLIGDENTKNYFLFHDYTTTTVFGQTDKKIYIKWDEKKSLNIITVDEKLHDDTFNSLVRSLSGALKFFVGFVSLAAKNYMAYVNDQRKNKHEPMQLEDAISSVLTIFNLEDTRTLQRIVLNDSRLSRLNDTHNILEYDLYTDGFEYYSFSNDDSHAMTTRLDLSFLDDTPEKFLLTLAKEAKVVALSATSQSNTVTGNFDNQYLEDNLREDYATPDDESLKLIEEHYKESLKKQDIRVCAMKIGDNDHPETSAFHSPAYQEQLRVTIYPYMDEKNKNTGEYFEVNRYCKAVRAIYDFLSCPTSHAMMMMTNQLLREKARKLFCAENVRSAIKLIERELGLKEVSTELVTISSSDFESQKAKYIQFLQDGKRVIIATSYNTASTGQNLYYKIKEDGVEKEYDIDAIYLEKPTYLLTRIEDGSEIDDMTEFIYEMEALRAHGEVTHDESMNYIRTAFRFFGNPVVDFGNTFNKTYATNSVNNHAVSVLKQATGRISRNRNKRPVTNIFIDNDILQKIRFDEELDKLQTPEFAKIIEFRNKEIKAPDEDLTELTKAATRAKTTGRKYRSLMETKDGGWTKDNMDEWEEIREFVLKHPTVSEQDLLDNAKMRFLYMHRSYKKPIAGYFYSLKDDKETVDQISYFDNGKVTIPMNSSSIGLNELMKCTYIYNYFSQNGYAQTFAPNDYILLPNVMRDIYKGALGEAAGRCLFDNKIGKKIVPITDPRKFEKFDFQFESDKDCYIDFKLWSETFCVNDEKYQDKVLNKLEEVKGKAAFVINILDRSKHKAYPFERDGCRVYVIPGLLKVMSNGFIVTNDDDIAQLKDILSEVLNDGNQN